MEENEILPIFEAFNVSSNIKAKYFEKKDKEPTTDKYSFHLSLVYHGGFYWSTFIAESLTSKDDNKPIVIVETFTEETKNDLKLHMIMMMDIAESREWNWLWFSDGKKMLKEYFTGLRNSWLQTIASPIKN